MVATFWNLFPPRCRAVAAGRISDSDLGGQKEFSWGEVTCHLAKRTNKDWLIVGYSREPRVPAPDKEVLLTLFAHEKPPES